MQKTTEIFNLRDQLRDLQYQLREKDCQIRDLKQSIQNLNLLHHHQSPGVHLENLSEFHSQDGGVMHPVSTPPPSQNLALAPHAGAFNVHTVGYDDLFLPIFKTPFMDHDG